MAQAKLDGPSVSESRIRIWSDRYYQIAWSHIQSCSAVEQAAVLKAHVEAMEDAVERLLRALTAKPKTGQ